MALFIISIVTQLSSADISEKKLQVIRLPYKVCSIAPMPEEALRNGIVPINTLKAKELFVEGAFFYDARKKAHYDKMHIQDATPITFDSSKAEYTIVNLPKSLENKLVFYCYGESCANSYEAALTVRKKGYKYVYWYINGLDEWYKKGYPVESK